MTLTYASWDTLPTAWVRRDRERKSLTQTQTSTNRFSEFAALTPFQPKWKDNIYRRFAELSGLCAGWDGHGGKPISDDVVAFTGVLMECIAIPGLPEPHVAPLSYGGLQLEWHAKDIDLEIEVIAPHHFSVLFEDAITGIEWEHYYDSSDLSDLKEPLKLLASR